MLRYCCHLAICNGASRSAIGACTHNMIVLHNSFPLILHCLLHRWPRRQHLRAALCVRYRRCRLLLARNRHRSTFYILALLSVCLHTLSLHRRGVGSYILSTCRSILLLHITANNAIDWQQDASLSNHGLMDEHGFLALRGV